MSTFDEQTPADVSAEEQARSLSHRMIELCKGYQVDHALTATVATVLFLLAEFAEDPHEALEDIYDELVGRLDQLAQGAEE